MKDDRNFIDMWYQLSTNTVMINAPEEAFDKRYLGYMLKHLGIPKDATIMFITTEAPNDNT